MKGGAIRPRWDRWLMDIAWTVSTRSEDPSTKVGCVIVDEKNKPVSFGYNGFLAGCEEIAVDFNRPKKYGLIIHAEMNALLNAKRDLVGCKLYCTHAPCYNCLKHILQSGIRFVCFESTELMERHKTEDLVICHNLCLAYKGSDIHCLFGTLINI